MARTGSPSTVMYAKLKQFGISNREAASLLLNTELTFDGRTLRSRIDDSSQLSRRIVHTAPNEIPQTLFNDFAVTTTRIENIVLKRARNLGEAERARQTLQGQLAGTCAHQMQQALRNYNVDDSIYRDTLVFIEQAILPHEEDRTFLHLMLFVTTGCLGNPRAASTLVVAYATDVLGAEFHTAPTVIEEEASVEVPATMLLGVVRIADGRVAADSKMHILNPAGTRIGLLPEGEHVISDVDAGVSRNHAYIWREMGRWYIKDLASTNGTRVISGTDGTDHPVGTTTASSVELFASDVICLGPTTRFIVMPVLGA